MASRDFLTSKPRLPGHGLFQDCDELVLLAVRTVGDELLGLLALLVG